MSHQTAATLRLVAVTNRRRDIVISIGNTGIAVIDKHANTSMSVSLNLLKEAQKAQKESLGTIHIHHIEMSHNHRNNQAPDRPSEAQKEFFDTRIVER